MDFNYRIESLQEPRSEKSFEKEELSSNSSCKCLLENKESTQASELETKASSYISNGTHETSFEFSESSF